MRARADLVKARVAAHNQLRAHLQLAHPATVGLFHQLDGKISLAFLTRFPTPRHAHWLSEKRLAAWLTAAHYTRPTTRTAGQLFDHLTQAPAGYPDGPAADAAQVITLELVALLTGLRERITAIETHIERALATHVDAAVFTSLPRSGTVRAATMLAEIGDARGRYPTDDALTAAAGISPSTHASGRAHYVAFRRGCNQRLRQAIVDFADASRAAHPWAQDIYARARGCGHNHAHAVRILARAWLRIIWRCWTDHTAYDSAHHTAVVAARTAASVRTAPANPLRRNRSGTRPALASLPDRGPLQPPAGGVQAGRRPPEGHRPGHRLRAVGHSGDGNDAPRD